ncbi:MAG: M48 family metallopeptidase [Phycisphaerae bacterium]
MYLPVLVVLSLVLAFETPPYPLIVGSGWTIASAAFATVAPGALAALVGRRVLQLLDANPADPGPGQYRYSRGVLRVQTVLLMLQSALMLTTDWLPMCMRTPVVGEWLVVPSLLALVPLLLSILLVWAALYPAERAVRQIALEIYLFRGKPVTPVPTLGRHLMYSLRHQVLFILAPMLLILAARDVIEHCAEPLQRASGIRLLPDLLMGVSAGLVALVAPLILRVVWVTQRLPDGPLRDRLQSVATKLRVRCAEILVWRSGGMLVNAAVMGLVGPLRYVLITDAMLEQMDDRQIEAVFGHEAGHIKRHHILFFFLFASITGALVTIVTMRTHGLDPLVHQLVLAGVGALLILKWGVLFGYVSRRFERQADVYGVRTLALAGVPCERPCALHGNAAAPTSFTQMRDPLCATAAELFSGTLHQVAVLNGIPPEAPSWRHSSISSRSQFVNRLAAGAGAAARFERQLWWIKIAILGAAALFGAWAAYEMRLPEALQTILTRMASRG